MSTLQSARHEVYVSETAKLDAAVKQPFKRFLLFLVAIPLAVYCATFPLLMNPNLPHLGFSKFGPVLDYSFNVASLNADVVIYGDSSAFIGIDPRIVNRETGLRTVVLPNTVGSLPITGDIPLERYLQRNRKPRLIVFYFSPWSLDYNRTQHVGVNFEGDEEVLRNGSGADRARYFFHHPLAFLQAPFRAYITLSLTNVIAYLRNPDRQGQTAAAFGHMDYTLPYAALSEHCHLSAAYASRVHDDSVRQLVRKYRQLGVPVKVYLAPIPRCAGSEIVASRSYAQLNAASPAVEPPSWFADDTYFAHIRPEDVRSTSRLFALALRSWVRQDANGG